VTATRPEGSEATLLDLVAVLARRWRLVVGLPLAAGVVAAIVSLLLPKRYTATTTFVPEVSSQRQLPAGLAGLAGQLGISLGGGGAATSPRFFADVLKSRALMEEVLLTRFPDPRTKAEGDSLPLLQLLRIKGRNPLDSLQKATRVFGDMVGARVDAQTNVVTLTVTTRFPELSAEAAAAFIKYLDEFNSQTRQSKGREQRRFVESRLAESNQQLQSAESRLKTFYEANRSWQQSPQLTFEEGRMRREVQVAQELYLTLSREYEKARIDEVNDTPGITVIDVAAVPQERSWPRRTLLVLMALVLGTLASLGWALGLEYFERLRRSDPAAYDRLIGMLPRLRRIDQ
jgi:uncharacterized protein involved in exopolysaccharide biosynthesis